MEKSPLFMDKASEKLFKKLCRKSGKTILEHNLIEPGDRILVGLSGGKDSFALLEILKERKKSLPFLFEIFAVHVKVTDSGYMANEPYLKDFCGELEVPLYVEEIQAGINEFSGKAPCFLCSWHRRKKIFELTRSLNCNKLSFGHHRDDALETLLINMIYHGSISSLPYKLKMFDGRVHLIRPLLDITDKEIYEYSILRNYSAPHKLCTFENVSKRKYVRELIESLNQNYEKSKINMFRAMSNIYYEYLPDKKP